jgi:hypothetical protein
VGGCQRVKKTRWPAAAHRGGRQGLRGAWTDADGQVTLFSAMAHGKAVTVAQVKVPDGTNETTQVRQLLQDVAEQGQAGGGHVRRRAHETAEYIAGERGFDYVMTVKSNLVDAGKIEYRKVGKHRRIVASALLDYMRRDDQSRRAAADEMSALSQDLGLV